MKQNAKNLLESIENLRTKIGVIGLGQVGLPTALSFSDVGFDVTGHDVNQKLLEQLKQGIAPFEEDGLTELLESCIKKNKFSVESSFEKTIERCDVLIVCVPTPLTESIRPDLSALENVCKSFSKLSLKNKMIIIESSIPPGTFDELVLKSLRQNDLGDNFWAAFVPERLAPGQALSEIRTTPRVIGCPDEDSGNIARTLYAKMITGEIYVTPVNVAEISKLVENTFRDVNVALANEVGLICERYGIDFLELQKICNSHPRVNLHKPGPGVGGPCLPKDSYLLLNPKGQTQIDSKIILYSRQINDSMPLHVVDLAKKALKRHGKDLTKSKIAVLGVAYKANVSDTRLSPAIEIIKQLQKFGSEVCVYDPKSKEDFGAKASSDINDAVKEADALIIVTDHNEFKNLNLNEIKTKMKTPIIVDTRRIYDSKAVESLGFTYMGVGYPERTS